MNKKLVWGIVIAIVVIAGLFGYYYIHAPYPGEGGDRMMPLPNKTYSNTKYGYSFKYPENYYAFNLDSHDDYVVATPEMDSVFITSMPLEQINNSGKEVGGVWISAWNTPVKHIEIEKGVISMESVLVDDQDVVEYTIKAMEDTQAKVIYFDKNGKYFRITEWGNEPLFDQIVSTFTFNPSPTTDEVKTFVTTLANRVDDGLTVSPVTLTWYEPRDIDPTCPDCSPDYQYKDSLSGFGFTARPTSFEDYGYFTSKGFVADHYNSGDATFHGTSAYSKGDLVCLVRYSQTDTNFSCANKKTGLLSKVKTN